MSARALLGWVLPLGCELSAAGGILGKALLPHYLMDVCTRGVSSKKEGEKI